MSALRASAALLAVLHGAPLLAQDRPELTFRSQVRRVLVDVFVTKDERPVTGLEAEDFEVLDNGSVQTNVDLLVVEDLPLVATLLLDTSRSVRGPKLHDLRGAAAAFIDELAAEDSVSIVSFGTHFRVIQGFTNDRAAAKASLNDLQGSGATAPLDSMLFSLVHGEALVRRLVVVFSDGLDTASWVAPDDLIASARRSDAVLFAVRAASPPVTRAASATATPIDLLGDLALRRIVGATAGRVVSLREEDRLEAAFRAVSSEMRSRYLLAYEPSDTAEGWHELTVRLKGERDLEVRARTGYYYP